MRFERSPPPRRHADLPGTGSPRADRATPLQSTTPIGSRCPVPAFTDEGDDHHRPEPNFRKKTIKTEGKISLTSCRHSIFPSNTFGTQTSALLNHNLALVDLRPVAPALRAGVSDADASTGGYAYLARTAAALVVEDHPGCSALDRR
ncbi:hypothetical protein [Kineococcus aurantiacus]|uniref:hypothetical protein n=1 Tax=Kineococcus aurantiacus TaxID=37633 RepID=UPI0031E366E1